jgi:hypothetical protein
MALLAAAMLVFGGLVEMRSAFMTRRMTDLGVYLRAGWAVRAGADIYDITDDNEWHYQYPPLLAILMMPLADPPPGADRQGFLPWPVSVAIWYVLGIVCVGMAVHVLAVVLEPGVPMGSRRWWAMRLLPALICMVPIGATLMRGQVNLIVLAALAGMIACQVSGRSFRAGLCLAFAICIKVIPAFLLLVPLWRRSGRTLLGCAAGLALGLAIVPSIVFGPARTVSYYREYAEKLLLPGLGRGDDQSRAKELIEVTASDSQSPLAIFHNTLHLDRATRPPHASAAVRWAHRTTGAVMALVVLLAAGWRLRPQPAAEVLFAGALMIVMELMSPVCHLHYFCFNVPAVAGVLAACWHDRGTDKLSRPMALFLGLLPVVTLLPHLPSLWILRDVGLTMYSVMALWLVACCMLWRSRQSEASQALAGSLPSAA